MKKHETDHRLMAAKENFSIWLLTGMMNSTKKFVKPVLGSSEAAWFIQCIQYMIDRIKEVQTDRINRR